MYTRLYTNVLNRYHAVDHCAGFHHCYADSGLFGIQTSVYPHFASSAANVIGQQLYQLCGPVRGGITREEFSRAKNMLKSTLVMALESRLTAVEGEYIPSIGRHKLMVDLGRQTLIHGNRVPVEEMCAKIDNLTLEVCRQLVRIISRS
jgi:processing peptidase subunit alpha